MLQKHYLKTLVIYTIIAFLTLFVFSCKTQESNVKPTVENKNNNAMADKNESPQEEKKPIGVNPDLLEEQKVNEFAKKKSGLLCSLNQLKRDLDNTSNESQKAEINEQIVQLKDQIAEFDKSIESTFPDEDRKAEIDKLAQSMSRDC